MKRLLPVALSLMLSATLLGCVANETLDAPSSMPEDFYIIYEIMDYPYHNDFKIALDTKNNIAGEATGYSVGSFWIPRWTLSPYYIPRNDLQDIYDAVIEYDIKSYSGSEASVVSPEHAKTYYRMTLCSNDEVFSITFGPSAHDEEREGLWVFQDIMSKKWAEGRPGPSFMY